MSTAELAENLLSQINELRKDFDSQVIVLVRMKDALTRIASGSSGSRSMSVAQQALRDCLIEMERRLADKS